MRLSIQKLKQEAPRDFHKHMITIIHVIAFTQTS